MQNADTPPLSAPVLVSLPHSSENITAQPPPDDQNGGISTTSDTLPVPSSSSSSSSSASTPHFSTEQAQDPSVAQGSGTTPQQDEDVVLNGYVEFVSSETRSGVVATTLSITLVSKTIVTF